MTAVFMMAHPHSVFASSLPQGDWEEILKQFLQHFPGTMSEKGEVQSQGDFDA